jgi:hypothetical protein
MKKRNLQSLSDDALRNFEREIREEQRRRLPKVVNRNNFMHGARTAKMTADCGHIDGGWREKPSYYPSFNIGLEKPFALLLGLCSDCAKKATIDSILTDERWNRMQHVLRANGVPIPARESITMQIETAIKPFDEREYPYALLA